MSDDLEAPLRTARITVGDNPIVCPGDALLLLYPDELVIVPDGEPPIRIGLGQLLSTGWTPTITVEAEDGDRRWTPDPYDALCWRPREGEEPVLVKIEGCSWMAELSAAVLAYWKRRTR